ncbi:MAG: DUF4339 domain-containing protein [Deltaproteobacteria bacterium]|nr:DUF4339 domain-containing protein [Deltaproteobacteria bacterium]
MENTSPFLFDNTDEKFFLALKGRAVGPLTAQEVYDKFKTGEAGLLHYFWREGWNDWKRVCDDREFAVLVPQKPTTASINHIREKLEGKKKSSAPQATGDGETKNYYLYFNSSQYGPFSKAELVHVLKSHKLGRSAYLWMPGWPNWKRLSEIEEFSKFMAPPAPMPDLENSDDTRGSEPRVFKKKGRGKTGRIERTRDSIEPTRDSVERTKESIERTIGARMNSDAGFDASNKRRAPRRPLVARLFLHNDKDVIIAVCRDISVGGMQVLTDRIPGPVGSMIKLNVSPGDPTKVKGFVAEGEIVRVLEDGRGFSFRFRKITDEARRAIERYIHSDS